MTKKIIPLFVGLFAICSTVQAQDSRPTTPRPKTVISMEEMNKLPAEIQQIIKANPQRFKVEGIEAPHVISAAEFASMPADKKAYILANPQMYRIEGAPTDANQMNEKH